MSPYVGEDIRDAAVAARPLVSLRSQNESFATSRSRQVPCCHSIFVHKIGHQDNTYTHRMSRFGPAVRLSKLTVLPRQYLP